MQGSLSSAEIIENLFFDFKISYIDIVWTLNVISDVKADVLPELLKQLILISVLF